MADRRHVLEPDRESSAYERLRRRLEGTLFHTRKELRHTAEPAGFLFVPTEVVAEDDVTAEFVLRPKHLR